MSGKLNCRPGDLAVIVRADFAPHAVGRIVRCVGRFDIGGKPTWEVSPRFEHYWLCRDKNLRPIRDQPGEDETLGWAGLPGKVEVSA